MVVTPAFIQYFFYLFTVLPFLVAAGVCLVYVVFGIRTLLNGYTNKNRVMIRSGWRTILIAVTILTVISFFFFRDMQ
jgi:hypothetical protein